MATTRRLYEIHLSAIALGLSVLAPALNGKP